MDGRRAGTHIGAVVLAGDRIHRILAQKPFLRRQLHRFPRRLFEAELVVAYRAIHIEDYAAGVLADGLRLVLGDSNVLLDDLHRAGGDGALLLAFEGIEDGLMYVIRDFGRGAADEFQQRILQHIHRPKAKRVRKPSQTVLGLSAVADSRRRRSARHFTCKAHNLNCAPALRRQGRSSSSGAVLLWAPQSRLCPRPAAAQKACEQGGASRRATKPCPQTQGVWRSERPPSAALLAACPPEPRPRTLCASPDHLFYRSSRQRGSRWRLSRRSRHGLARGHFAPKKIL